jgi:glycerol-3-phosphate acyltransferase PlsX
MRLALDAMGGDHAPKEIVAGALLALEQLSDDDHIILVGDESAIRSHLGQTNRWEAKISIEHASQVVAMDESPVDALRRKRDSSIAVMAKLAAKGDADVVVSAGNTGACVAICQLRMRLLPGAIRPGILVVFPTTSGPIAICDVGANVAPKPSHLHQYALMSSLYMQEVFGTQKPTVGLISIGQEDTKGNELIKTVNQILRDDERLDFIGNVEPRNFLNRPCDVAVCDGMVGNVILKMAEGMAESMFRAIMHELEGKDSALVEEFRPVVEAVYARHDHSVYGGAPLLGIDGTCIICHGSSDARTIKNVILRTKQQVELCINKKIVDILQLQSVTED